jgi:hypothetical protein
MRAVVTHVYRICLGQGGAKLVAVSPQTPDKSLSTAEKNALAFGLKRPWLSGSKSCGIACYLAEELRPIYASFAHAFTREER